MNSRYSSMNLPAPGFISARESLVYEFGLIEAIILGGFSIYLDEMPGDQPDRIVAGGVPWVEESTFKTLTERKWSHFLTVEQVEAARKTLVERKIFIERDMNGVVYITVDLDEIDRQLNCE